MKIDSLKDLEALVKMCNKHGVSTITVDGVAMKLDGAPDANKLKTEESSKTGTADQYTDEQVLMWSAGIDING